MIGCRLQETDDKLAARTRENRVSERVGQANDVAVRSIFRKLKDSSCNWIKLLEGKADLSLSLFHRSYSSVISLPVKVIPLC